MKRGEKNLLIYCLIVLLILLINSFVYNFLSGLYFSLFMGICLLVFKLIFGFEKSNFRVSKEVLLDTIIVVLVFFLGYYLFGIIITFAKTGNYFTWGGIKNYILPTILTVIFKEILRFNFLIKVDGKKRLILLSLLTFIFVDITNVIYLGNFSTASSTFKLTALNILPAISYNIYATYTSINTGYKSIIVYALVIGLYTYIIPIIPNAGEYLLSIIRFLLPVVLLYRVYNTVKNESDEKIEREYNKKDYVGLILASIFVVILVYFSSGYFKYHAIAIATGSMSPAIERGDVVIVKKTKDYENLQEGEVIAYNYHNVIVVHRLARKVKVDDEYYFYSRGDANRVEDNYIVKQDMIEGVVKVRIPLIGMPTVWLNELWEE